MSKPCVLVTAAALMACLPTPGTAPAFDGERAYAHARKLVDIGPRPAGSEGAARARAYIAAELQAIDIAVEEQAFDAATPLGRWRMVNLRALLPATTGARLPRLLIAGHYDTKYFAGETFVGANDGGSSAAFLIELARVLKARPQSLAVELVFFDGEEAVVEWQGEDNTYGSRHYVAAARQAGALPDIRAMILVDMIGDRDLRIRRESNSTPWLTDLLWSTAKRLGRPEFVDEFLEVSDDHLPFLQAGIPAVNIIDLDYPAWHTPADTIDKISPRSLQAVGDVLLAALPDICARLAK